FFMGSSHHPRPISAAKERTSDPLLSNLMHGAGGSGFSSQRCAPKLGVQSDQFFLQGDQLGWDKALVFMVHVAIATPPSEKLAGIGVEESCRAARLTFGDQKGDCLFLI